MGIINLFDDTIIKFANSLHANYKTLDFFSMITNLGEALPLIILTSILIFIKRTIKNIQNFLI